MNPNTPLVHNRENFNRLHKDCGRAATAYQKRFGAAFTFLGGMEEFPLTIAQRIEFSTYKRKEDEAHSAYLIARNRFFDIYVPPN
jgi:hypothetical protein